MPAKLRISPTNTIKTGVAKNDRGTGELIPKMCSYARVYHYDTMRHLLQASRKEKNLQLRVNIIVKANCVQTLLLLLFESTGL